MSTLTILRDRAEQRLLDNSNAIFTTGLLEECVRLALHEYSGVSPQRVIGTITLGADGREVALSSLTGLLTVDRVWYDYDAADPDEPPQWRRFEVWPGNILYLPGATEPASGEVLRVYYTRLHTLNGLDSASVTTIPADHYSLLVEGAAGYAATSREVDLTELVAMSEDAVGQLRAWGESRLGWFRGRLAELRPRELAGPVSWGGIGL